MDDDLSVRRLLRRAADLARHGMQSGEGGPFGCVVARGSEVVAEGWNRVLATQDPTAHAEVVAIRRACAELGSFQLDGCSVYASCEPCPMCLGAIYWARPLAVYFSATRADAADAGFDDSYVYDELATPGPDRGIPFRRVAEPAGAAVLAEWQVREGRVAY